MPEKKTKANKQYRVSGKDFTWTTEEGEEVTIPLRVKLKIIRELADADANNVGTMFRILEQIIPGQTEVLDEMDVNDFTAMFTAWNEEYTTLTGAAMGESPRSTS